MFTFHHGFWLYFLTRRHPDVWQFVIGSMLPDYIYFVLLGLMLLNGQVQWHGLFDITPAIMMSFLPLYPWVVKIDLIGHSAVIWLVVFILALLPGIRRWRAFVVGWGTHLLLDGITHAEYANFFLYPLSLVAVHSPVSYWEPQYFAREFKLVNGTLIALTTAYLLYHWWHKRRLQREEE